VPVPPSRQSRLRRSASQHRAHSAPVPWTTKLRVNRPHARRRRSRSSREPPSSAGSPSSTGRSAHCPGRAAAEQGVHHLAAFARAGGLLHESDRPGVPAGQPGHHPPALPPGAAVHRPEHPDLGVGPGRHRSTGDHALVQVGGPRRLGHGRVAAHPGEHPRLQLRDVGDDEPPPRVGDRRRTDLRRDRQRTATGGRPPSGHDPAGQEVRAEPAVPDPGVQPVPAVGSEQPGQLLVLQQQRDPRVVELLEGPGAGVGHRQPRRLQGAQQAGRRVRVQLGSAEGRPDPQQQPVQRHRAPAGRRPRAEQLAQQPVVDVGAPRQPGVGHLGGHQGTGGLGRQQQPEAPPLRCRGDRRLLARQLRDRIEPVGRVVEGEEPRVRRGDRLQRPPRVGVRPAEHRLVDERGPPEDGMAQPQVGAALDPQPGVQEARVPPGGVVPDPADGGGVARADVAGELVGRQPGHLGGGAVVGELVRLDLTLAAAHEDDTVHRRSLADGSDGPDGVSPAGRSPSSSCRRPTPRSRCGRAGWRATPRPPAPGRTPRWHRCRPRSVSRPER
jgi:hypothetical protein